MGNLIEIAGCSGEGEGRRAGDGKLDSHSGQRLYIELGNRYDF